MVTDGRVIGGAYMDAAVTSATFGSGLVVQAGFKGRKLNADHVARWEEVTPDSTDSTASAVSQAVVGALLPRFIGKSASAAVAATFDGTTRPSHNVRVHWTDGKQSLLKLPDKLFTHFEILLAEQRVTRTEVTAAPNGNESPQKPDPHGVTEAQSLPEQAFSLVAGLINDRLRPSTASDTEQIDLMDQLSKLAALRDAGVLTEAEFDSKKKELLSRL